MKEREEAGMLVCNETQIRSYIVVAYTMKYNEPNVSEWPRIVKEIIEDIGAHPATIKAVFRKCRDGDPNPAERKKELDLR